MPVALVVGASRGLGLEFTTRYVADGWTVWATHRAPEDAGRLQSAGARPFALDVLGNDAPGRLSSALGGEAVDVAIVNAGIHGPKQIGILHPPSASDFDLVMRTNVHGPMRLLPPIAPLLERGRGTLAFITSSMGSIAAAGTGHGLLYRVSKAAENMVAKVAHVELAPLGIRVVALNPGWVRTDMGGPDAPVEASESVAGMRRVIADSAAWPGGGFYDFRGESLAW